VYWDFKLPPKTVTPDPGRDASLITDVQAAMALLNSAVSILFAIT
jgi:hypothetical protein